MRINFNVCKATHVLLIIVVFHWVSGKDHPVESALDFNFPSSTNANKPVTLYYQPPHQENVMKTLGEIKVATKSNETFAI